MFIDEREAVFWLRSGRPIWRLIEDYEAKYGVKTTVSMWGNLRRRHGIEARRVDPGTLMPWQVREEHRYAYPAMMLRMLARRRAGREDDLRPEDVPRLDAWLEERWTEGTVVHYDPGTEEGWSYVPRRDGVDVEVVRRPD